MILDNNHRSIMFRKDTFKVNKDVLIPSLLCYNNDKEIFLSKVERSNLASDAKRSVKEVYDILQQTLDDFLGNVSSVSKVIEYGNLISVEVTVQPDAD